jgi:arabinogalactan endo-1,4-beta-galactosidase
MVILICTLLLFSSCEQEKQAAFDYVQYEPFDMSPYDLLVQVMLPNASSGIGTSMKPQVAYEIGGFKWTLSVGRNFRRFTDLPQKSKRRICSTKKCTVLHLQRASNQSKLLRNHEP